MIVKWFRLGAAAALLVMGAARAEDAAPPQTQDRQRDPVHAAMHDAMQKQMAAPPASPQMPGMAERPAADASAAHQRAENAQQNRDAARRRAMAHGARDAAMARGGDSTRGGMQSGTMHEGGMVGCGAGGTQDGAAMMRTGDMHGGSGGMMPGGGGMTPGGGGMMPGGGAAK